MELLILSDIHNDVENIINFVDKIEMLKFDVIVCPGDFTDVVPKGFTKADITKLILEELGALNKPIVAVPGNQDKEIIGFLENENVSVHGKGIVVDGVGFYGFGGAKTPFNTPLEPSEEDIENGLKAAYAGVKNAKTLVQVTHIPPARTRLDSLYGNIHIGSESVRKFIEEKQPTLAICAHLHESRGLDEIGKTKLINSGRFPEGYVGLVSIENGLATAKIVNLI